MQKCGFLKTWLYKKLKTHRFEFVLFLVPAFSMVLLLMIYPIGREIFLSTRHYHIGKPWITGSAGMENFKKALSDPEFRISLWNSLIWVGSSVSIQFSLGLGIAILLNKTFRGRGFFRVILITPWAVSGVLTAIMWMNIYSPGIGVLNYFLRKLGVIEISVAWLSHPDTAMVALVIANVWRGAPFFIMVMLAALQSVPPQLLEAGKIDGANRWQEFGYITLPFIRSAIITSLLLRTLWIFNYVDIIYMMTGGGPAGMTQTLATYTYTKAYVAHDLGYAAALAVLLMLVLAVFTMVYLVVLRRGEVYE